MGLYAGTTQEGREWRYMKKETDNVNYHYRAR